METAAQKAANFLNHEPDQRQSTETASFRSVRLHLLGFAPFARCWARSSAALQWSRARWHSASWQLRARLANPIRVAHRAVLAAIFECSRAASLDEERSQSAN